jgi:anti-sigma factor RsiW
MRLPWRREPRPITCAEVGAVLQAYLDDEIDEIATRRVTHHLEDCLRCGMEVVTYRRIKESLGRRGPDLDPASMARLRAFGERLAAGDVADPGDAPAS